MKRSASSKCKCGGNLSIIAIMVSDQIPLDTFLNLDASNYQEIQRISSALDEPNGAISTLELRCSMCQTPEPEDETVRDYLIDIQFKVEN